MKNKKQTADVAPQTPVKTSKVGFTLKTVISAVLLTALVVTAGVMVHRNVKAEKAEALSDSEARVSEQVAYTSDIKGHIAMFVVPINYSTNGHRNGFEMKASLNNFNRPVPRATGPNDSTTLAFYSQSATADKDIPGEDKMKVFVANFEQNHTRDYRSYCYITNTLDYRKWFNYAIVLIDKECLVRNTELDDRGESVWLHSMNNDLIWVYGRLSNTDRERNPEAPTISLWTPIQPVRWFTKMPNWGGTFEQLKGDPIVQPVDGSAVQGE